MQKLEKIGKCLIDVSLRPGTIRKFMIFSCSSYSLLNQVMQLKLRSSVWMLFESEWRRTDLTLAQPRFYGDMVLKVFEVTL